MSYWVRVFCEAPDVPTVRELFFAMANAGFDLTIAPELGMFPTIDLDAPDWCQVGIQFRGRIPMMCELTRNSGVTASLLQLEVDQFTKLVDETEDTPAKEEVKARLAATTLIVSFQLLSGMEVDKGWELLCALCNYFVDRNNGLFHADNKGFQQRIDSDNVLVAAG